MKKLKKPTRPKSTPVKLDDSEMQNVGGGGGGGRVVMDANMMPS